MVLSSIKTRQRSTRGGVAALGTGVSVWDFQGAGCDENASELGFENE